VEFLLALHSTQVLKKPSTKIKVISIALMTLFYRSKLYWILEILQSDIVKYDQDMVAFSVLEEKALGLYSLHQSASDEIYLERNRNQWNS